LLTQAQPDYAEAWLVRGSIEFQNQDLQQAEQSLNRYLGALPASRAQEDPDEDSLTPRGIVQAYLLLSQIAEKQGDFAKAQSFLARINSPQDIARVQIRRALMMAKQGRTDEALSLVNNLPEDDADQARTKLQAQLSILRDGRREEEAYTLISQANQKTPDDADLLYDLALSAEKLGRADEMEKILRRVITLQPDYHAAYNALGYSLADRNQRLPDRPHSAARRMLAKAAMRSQAASIRASGWVRLTRNQPCKACPKLSPGITATFASASKARAKASPLKPLARTSINANIPASG
jgi:tetratricopeptide (TPR) repeat protein